MLMRRMLLTLVLVVAVALGGCQRVSPTAPLSSVLRAATYDTLHSFPAMVSYRATSSPDGAIFVSLFDGSIWRGDTTGTWAPLPTAGSTGSSGEPFRPEQLFALYAPSRELVFAASGAGIYRWTPTGGLVREITPIPTHLVGCGDFITGERFQGIGGRGVSDVTAVGVHGLIAHYDGAQWTRERHPLREDSSTLCFDDYPTNLFAVAGNAGGVYAAALTSIAKRDEGASGKWHAVAPPPGREKHSGMLSVVAQPDAHWFAGDRLFELRAADGRWQDHSAAISGVRTLNGGTAHPTGPIVFWNFDREIVVVRGREVRAYAFPKLVSLRGAIPVGDAVYLIADGDVGTLILRVNEN